MNFSIYMNSKLYQDLETTRQLLGKSRNRVVQEALIEWLNSRQQTKWPANLFYFDENLKDVYPDIKEIRKDVIEPKEYTF